MKWLFVNRHAKSSWANPELSDHDRPLNPRGLKNAPEMGKRLAAFQGMPQTIITSSATRALHTTDLIAQQLSHVPHVLVNPDLYTEDWQVLEDIVENLDDKWQSAMLVGHNPAINDFLLPLSLPLDNLPTAGVVLVCLQSSHWCEWSNASKQLVYLDYPKRGSI